MTVHNSVVQQWVGHLTWKMQTVLFCALRGPDAGGSKELKAWTRFIRRNVLENAAPNKTFMQQEESPSIKELERIPLVLDMLPVHYFGHLMHALQIIGYCHPDQNVGSPARVAYYSLVEYLHLAPESRTAMEKRLADEVEK